MSGDQQIVISEPDDSGRGQTAGLAVEQNKPHPAKGDYRFVNFWESGSAEVVHFNEEEIPNLIAALEALQQGGSR